MAFDPKRARESGSGNGDGVPAGVYLLAITWMKRATSKKNTEYERVKCTVISGAAKGKTFFDMVNLDTENQGAAFRLGLLLGELNGDEPIDLADDEAVRRALMFKPFKADVARRTENGYVNNGIAKFLVGDKVTEGEREAMEMWKVEREAEQDMRGGSEEFDRSFDGDAPHSAQGGTMGDDVPF